MRAHISSRSVGRTFLVFSVLPPDSLSSSLLPPSSLCASLCVPCLPPCNALLGLLSPPAFSTSLHVLNGRLVQDALDSARPPLPLVLLFLLSLSLSSLLFFSLPFSPLLLSSLSSRSPSSLPPIAALSRLRLLIPRDSCGSFDARTCSGCALRAARLARRLRRPRARRQRRQPGPAHAAVALVVVVKDKDPRHLSSLYTCQKKVESKDKKRPKTHNAAQRNTTPDDAASTHPIPSNTA